jgi:hypothetical protein
MLKWLRKEDIRSLMMALFFPIHIGAIVKNKKVCNSVNLVVNLYIFDNARYKNKKMQGSVGNSDTARCHLVSCHAAVYKAVRWGVLASVKLQKLC